MSNCGCSSQVRFEGISRAYRQALVWVIAINATLFMIEMGAGVAVGSQALQADALDFLGDTLTYGLSLAVIGQALVWRARTALLKGVSLLVMGLWVLASTLYQMLVLGAPHALVMSVVGLLALAANLASVLILYRFRTGDANVRSVWLCSRNDAISNLAVIAAAGIVAWTGSAWPDLVVALAMACLFLHSASLIVGQALNELKEASSKPTHTSSSADPAPSLVRSPKR